MYVERNILKNIFGILLVLLICTGCEKEIEVLQISDTNELEQYIAYDDLGKTFFSTANLISELPYFYPFDSTGYYVDLFDSLDREIISFFPLKKYGDGYSNPSQEFGSSIGASEDAEVTVHDRLYARTIRVEGIDTTVVNALIYRDYIRYGYFMKLGDDGQLFSGWLLRGFNGGSPDRNSRMSMFHANNQWFPGDTFAYQHRTSAIVNNATYPPDTIKNYSTTQGYLMLSGDPQIDRNIESVDIGEKLRAEVTFTYYGVFYTMLYNSSDSVVLQNFTLNNDLNYEVLIQTPSVNNNTWGFIYFQEFAREQSDTTAVPIFQTLRRFNWVIPFKIE